MTEHFHECPRCGQTVIGHKPRACDRCAALERARAGGEPLRLFTPAPVQMPGQMQAAALDTGDFYRCALCGGIHDTGAACPNPEGGTDAR